MADKLSDLVREFRWGRMDVIAHREAMRAGELMPLELSAEVAGEVSGELAR